MNFHITVQVGLREILAHKFRSFLTMFGIILGVASLVAMFATVEGMTRGMRERLMMSGGVERISVIDQEVPIEQEDIKSLSPGRTLADVRAIQQECPLIVDISPEVNLGGSGAALQYLNKTTRPKIAGVTPSFMNVNNFEIELGRFISDLDLEGYTQVCVIGWSVWEQLEQSRATNPLGKVLKINDVPFRIVGVFRDYESEFERNLRESGRLKVWQKRAEERRSGAANKRGVVARRWSYSWYKNNVVTIPISTMQVIFKSASLQLPFDEKGPDPRLSELNLKVVDAARLGAAVQQVKTTLMKIHRNIEDFGFDTREDWAENIEASVRASRLSGGIIAGISLLVGGIGIANIMLASITERIREIGIRLAVGARGRDIFLQILIESSVLGFLGGLIGIGAAFGVVELIKVVAELNNEPVIQFTSLAISFSFSVLTGLLAGIYPAFKASRLDPIQALRYE